MNHQSFEHSIFEPEKQTRTEQIELRQHLADCVQCRQLEEKWAPVSNAFKKSSLAAPQNGFVTRWQLNFEKRRAAEQRKQIIISLGISALLIVVCIAGLYLLDFSQWNFQRFLVTITTCIAGLLSMFLQTWQYMNALFSAIPLFLTVILWVAVTTSFCLISFFWFFSLWKLTSKGDLAL